MKKQNVFITGAASGIGLATAKFLHEQGFLVGMADLSLSALQDVTKDWNQDCIRLFELDVTSFQQSQQVMDEFCEAYQSSLSILINNAGILQIGPFESISNEQHARTINVNIMGVINMCQAAFPYLKQQPNAKVINLCSASSDYGIPELTTYSASKHAVKAVTESLEIEWHQHDIQVCDVLPPFISTNMLSSQKTTAKVMGRLGVDLKAEDVVNVIYKQIKSAKTHRTVGVFYGLLHRLNNISPFFIRRLMMKFLSR